MDGHYARIRLQHYSRFSWGHWRPRASVEEELATILLGLITLLQAGWKCAFGLGTYATCRRGNLALPGHRARMVVLAYLPSLDQRH
jgi:hypothetical protein